MTEQDIKDMMLSLSKASYQQGVASGVELGMQGVVQLLGDPVTIELLEGKSSTFILDVLKDVISEKIEELSQENPQGE